MIEVNVDKKGTVKVSGNLTLVNVGDLHERLIKALDAGLCKILDCSEIKEIDTASLQALLAFKRSASISKPVQVIASEPMQEVLAMLGLRKILVGA